MAPAFTQDEFADFWVDSVVPRLNGLLRSILQDQNRVEEVLAVAFFKVWNAYKRGTLRFLSATSEAQSFDTIGSAFFSFAQTTSVREAYHHLRGIPGQYTDVDIWDKAPSILDQIIQEEEAHDRVTKCRNVLHAINERHRGVLLLWLEYPNYESLAQVLEISVTTLKPLLFRARESFRRAWIVRYGDSLEMESCDYAR